MKQQILAAFAAGAFATVFAAAHAQTLDPADVGLHEVVVTAEKMSQSVEKAPISVTVFSAEKLQQMGAQSFMDYAPSVPALSFESLGPGEQRVLLRGVSDGVDTGLRGSTQNTTGIYIDDMVVSNNETSPDLNLFDVERVEVLKGPQGTLYGDGSVGGLLRIITHKPDVSRNEGEVEAIGGAINQGGGDYSLNGMYNVVMVQDKLALRVVAQYRDDQGFVDDLRSGRKDVNNLRQVGGRASLRWVPQDDFTLTGSLLHQKTELGNLDQINGVLGGALLRNTYYPEPKTTRFTLTNVTADWRQEWGELVSSSSYAVYDHDDFSDFTDFLTTAIDADFGVPGIVLPSHAELRQHSDTFSQEFRLSSPAGQRVSWIGGLYYFDMKEIDREVDISDGLFDFAANTLGLQIAGSPYDVGHDVAFRDDDERTRRRKFAAFGELSFHFTDQLTGTIGGRWFKDELSVSQTPGGLFFGDPVTHLDKETDDHNQVFRFRLADQISDDALVYALASQGYRSGGLNPLDPATINEPKLAFDPDKLWNYEIGWKTRWFDRRLKVDGAVFYIDWTNEQIEISLPGGFSLITNAGKTTIKGVEADLALTPLTGLELGASGSYLAAQLARDVIDSGALVGAAGDQLTGVPKSQGNLYAQYRFPVREGLAGVVRGEAQYVGKTSRYFAHDTRVPAPADDFEDYGDYTLVNVRGGLEWKDMSVIVFVKNAADKRAVLFRGLQGTSLTPTRDDIYVAQPRTIGVTFSKSF